MAFSRLTKLAVVDWITDQFFADEIERRLFLVAPVTKANAAARLLTLNYDGPTQQELTNRLVWDTAGSGAEGAELAKKIVGMIQVLFQMSSWVAAHYTGTPAGAATAVTVTASHAGVLGNSIVLTFTGGNTIAQAVATWNAAHASNHATVTAGNDGQTPGAGSVTLTGGVGNLAAAQAAVGPGHMSAATYAVLISALASEAVALEFKTQYNLMVDMLAAIVVP